MQHAEPLDVCLLLTGDAISPASPLNVPNAPFRVSYPLERLPARLGGADAAQKK